MNDFLRGAAATAALAIAVFFLRYWRTSRERLFLSFSVAFVLLSLNWALPAIGGPLAPHAHVFRFVGFALIAYAVIDKNRRGKRSAG